MNITGTKIHLSQPNGKLVQEMTVEEMKLRIKTLEEENKYLLARLEHSEYERFKSYLTSTSC